jgi:hypothetical protein
LLLKKAGIKYSGSSKDINQQLKSMGKLFDKKLKEDPEKYKKYEYNAQKMYTGLKVNQMIDGILAIQNKLESLGEGEEEFKPSVQKKGKDTIAEDFDEATAKIQEVYQKNKGTSVVFTFDLQKCKEIEPVPTIFSQQSLLINVSNFNEYDSKNEL